MSKEKVSKKDKKVKKQAEIWTDGQTYNVQFNPPLSYKRLKQLEKTGLVRSHIEINDGKRGRRYPELELKHEDLPPRERHDFILYTLSHHPGTLHYIMPDIIEYRARNGEDS